MDHNLSALNLFHKHNDSTSHLLAQVAEGVPPGLCLVWRASPFTRGGRVWRRAYTRLVPAALYSAVQSDSYT